MANIAQLKKIISMTPVKQSICVQGRHGIGKSEIIGQMAKEVGARPVYRFAGQNADVGDIIGLPKITEKTLRNGEVVEVTDFKAPDWWPHDPTEHIWLILDEFNRADKTIMQCLMDLVLNHELNGKPLPPNTRVIGLMNPVDDGYMVDDLDMALVDRFNTYTLIPTTQEWVEWARQDGVDELIIEFIHKNPSHLDPPPSETMESGHVYSSRRSWVRVSDCYKQNTKDLDMDIFQIWCIGVVGRASTSAFCSFIKQRRDSIDIGKMMLQWNDKYADKINKMSEVDITYLNDQIIIWLTDHENEWIDEIKLVAGNMKNYMDCGMPIECVTHMVDAMANIIDKCSWPLKMMEAEPTMTQRLYEARRGSRNAEIKPF